MIWAFIMLRMYKAAAVLSVLMKVYTIHCHDRGHINVMVVVQSCTDPLQVLPGSSSETFPTSSDYAYDYGNAKVEEDIGIKQEQIPEDINFPGIKSEPDDVSYVCICLLLDTFHQCPLSVIRHILLVSRYVSCF
jgi:hypothetical protein